VIALCPLARICETMTSSTIDLLDLAAAALSASIVASDQITSLARQRDGKEASMHIRLKEDGSVVTDADLVAQQIIVQSIRKVSTDVRIVGEESEEEMNQHAITGHEQRAEEIFRLAQQEIGVRYHQTAGGEDAADTGTSSSHLPLSQSVVAGEPDSVPDTTLSTAVVCSKPLPQHIVATERVAVFVDPLDGTKAYARGDYAPVSILISIILDKEPCFGVICKPFGYPGQPSVLDTGCVAIYGGILLGAAYTAGGGYCTKVVVPTETLKVPQLEQAPSEGLSDSSSLSTSISTEDLPRAVISSSRSQGVVEDFVSHLGSKGMIHPTPLLISGAGEKSLRILLRSEKEGLWFFPKAGTSLWDVAASDALLRATGGRLTDKNGRDMDYSKTRLEAENHDGVVACYDKLLHAECIKLFLEGSWTTES
jgi:3'-phosphoadenosine 5'-phosphosulfate (PAPS) 3'-phosphatase